MSVTFKHADEKKMEEILARLSEVVTGVESIYYRDRQPRRDEIYLLSIVLGSIHNDLYIATHEGHAPARVKRVANGTRVVYAFSGDPVSVECEIQNVLGAYPKEEYDVKITYDETNELGVRSARMSRKIRSD